MPQLSEPVHLEDKDLDYEEGELEYGDAERESIVSLDTMVDELTKARKAGNKKSKSTSALYDIAQDLDLSEKTGYGVFEELANIVNSLLKDKIPDEKTQAKVDQYPKPANIEGLRTPRVNPLIWSQLQHKSAHRTRNIKSDKIHLWQPLSLLPKQTKAIRQQRALDHPHQRHCFGNELPK